MFYKLKKIKKLLIQKLYEKYNLLFWYKISPLNRNYFRDKTVVIVGPAISAFQIENGNYIDSFDIVIRINRGVQMIETESKFIGQRTNILFHGLNQAEKFGCGPHDFDLWSSRGVEMIVYPIIEDSTVPMVSDFLKSNNGKLALNRVSHKSYNLMKKLLKGSRPTTGFSAIFYVFQTDFKLLYITGFSFFKTEYFNYKKTETNWPIYNNIHSPDMEFDIFKHECKKNRKRVILDEYLNDIVKNG